MKTFICNTEDAFRKKRLKAMFLMVLGSCLISFTGLIIRDMDSAGALQINFYRGLSLSVTTLLILLCFYRRRTAKKILEVGKQGLAAGSFLALAGICLIQAITTTTVAATLFICAAIPFITALLAWVFLKEKMSRHALITMILAGSGVALMMLAGFRSNSVYGVFMAFGTAVSFSGFAVLLRKNKNLEMLPCLIVSGLIITLFCLLLLGGDISIAWSDLVRCVFLGSFITLIPNSLFIYASKYLLAAELTFLCY